VELFALETDKAVVARLARLVAEDPEPSVARAAAVVLCAHVAPRGRRVPRALAALRAARAMERLRREVESPAARTDQLLDLARCLRRSNRRADRRALARLRGRNRRLRRLLLRLR
jgi:hypothetical protein